MTTTQLRRRKDRMYGIGDQPNQYAFFDDGGDAVACLYNDGLYVGERATSGDGFTNGRILLEDSEGLVGPGSLIGDAMVWDVEGNVVHTYEVPAGWVAVGFVYGGGYIWWVESDEITAVDHSDTEVTVRLMRARADFSDPEQVGTDFVIDVAGGAPINHFDPGYTYFVGFALTATSAIAYVRIRAVDDNHESTEWLVYRVLWSLSGGAPSSVSFANGDASVEPYAGLPNSAGSATVVSYQDQDLNPVAGGYLQENDEADSPNLIWAGTIWDDEEGPSQATSWNVSPNGSTAQVYGSRLVGDDTVFFIGRASAISAASVWTAKAQVSPHPELGDPPVSMFYFGGS